MKLEPNHSRFFDDVGHDEFGIEFGRSQAGPMRSSYQPIFTVGKRGQLKMTALRAGLVVDGPAAAAGEVAERLAAPLALRNFGHSASAEIDLYIDQSVAGGWSSTQLIAIASQGRLAGFLAEPRRVYLECAPGALVAPLPRNSSFRRALVNERPDDQLDAWISHLRPGIVRFEGNWIADLARHTATRTLLATLVGMLKRRGVRTLFEGLDSDDLVAFAMDCGADHVQGAALAKAVVAGERIDCHSEGRGAKVIPVRFGRGGIPTVA